MSMRTNIEDHCDPNTTLKHSQISTACNLVTHNSGNPMKAWKFIAFVFEV